jgi:hypothetical protein
VGLKGLIALNIAKITISAIGAGLSSIGINNKLSIETFEWPFYRFSTEYKPMLEIKL